MFSIGEMRWRILRRLLKHRKGAGFSVLRSWCRYAKDVQNFKDLVRLGCIIETRPHTGRRASEEGHWQITPFGREVADLGEVSYEVFKEIGNATSRSPI